MGAFEWIQVDTIAICAASSDAGMQLGLWIVAYREVKVDGSSFFVEVSLERLDRHDPALRLRTIAVMKMDGSKHREIAAALGLPLSVIEHRVRLMRAILAGRGSEPH